MKRLFGLVAASAIIALASPGAALAAPVTTTDTTGFGLHLCLSRSAAPCNDGVLPAAEQTVTLDIRDNGFVLGSFITSAQLVLKLADDGGTGEGQEKISLLLDDVPLLYTDDANHDAVIPVSNLGALLDGRLVVRLSADSGDFFFEGADLTVVSDPALAADGSHMTTAGIPGLAGLMMLGAGMIAAVVWGRRRPR